MGTDGNMGRAAALMSGAPFNELVESADATTNGVEVIPAVAGKTPYVLGYQIANEDAGAINFILVHTAAASGKTAIGVREYVAATATTSPVHHFNPPIAGAVSQNIGFVASGAGNVDLLVFGYYA